MAIGFSQSSSCFESAWGWDCAASEVVLKRFRIKGFEERGFKGFSVWGSLVFWAQGVLRPSR